MQPNLLTALDHWIARQADAPTRPEALRRIVEAAIGALSDGDGEPSSRAVADYWKGEQADHKTRRDKESDG